MKRIFQICVALAVAVSAVGCYNDFDTPAPAKVYTDDDFAGLEHITIAELKQMFLDEFNSLGNTGENSSWADTKYLQIDKDVYIKGKVMSNDEEGNVYKSLYLCDETGAIEVKLTTGIYMTYPTGHFDRETGTMKSTWVYVKLKGLYLGNYRMMLSVGDVPTDSYNKVGEHKFYANSNIEDATKIAAHVFVGEPTVLTTQGENPDILEITEATAADFFGEANQDKLGRMVLIRDVTCRYGTVGSNLYPSWMYTDSRPTVSKYWYTWAFNNKKYTNSTNLYGSVLFAYGSSMPTGTLKAGVYSVRTSGYARFAGKPVLRDGAKGDILAIFGIYSKSWTYSYGAYQLSVNRFEDIMFDPEDFLTAEEVYLLTPNGYPDNVPDPELPDGGYNPDNDSYLTPASADDEIQE